MTKSGSIIKQARDGFAAVVDRIREAVRDGLDAMRGTFNGGAGNRDRFYHGAMAVSVATARLPRALLRRKHASRPRR